MTPRATPGDVEWIDSYGHARICGQQVHKATILALEQPDDRRADGHLTAAAKERIAADLTTQLCDHSARELAAWRAAGKPIIWRSCDG